MTDCLHWYRGNIVTNCPDTNTELATNRLSGWKYILSWTLCEYCSFSWQVIIWFWPTLHPVQDSEMLLFRPTDLIDSNEVVKALHTIFIRSCNFRLPGWRRWDQLRGPPGGGQSQCELQARGVPLQRSALLCGERLAVRRGDGESRRVKYRASFAESIRVIGEIEFIHMVISTNSTWKRSISLCCCSLIGWMKIRKEQYFSEIAHSFLTRT